MICTWWRDGKENSCIEEKCPAQAPRRAGKRGGAERQALVAACDRTQRCANPREGRLQLPRSQADRGVLETVGRKKQASEKQSLSLRALHAHLLYQSCRQEPACFPQNDVDAGKGRAAQAIRQGGTDLDSCPRCGGEGAAGRSCGYAALSNHPAVVTCALRAACGTWAQRPRTFFTCLQSSSSVALVEGDGCQWR